MCQLLIWNKASLDGSHQRGDVISIVTDSHKFSINEDKSEWVAAGNAAEDWDGHTWIIKIIGISVTRAKRLLAKHYRAATIADREFTSPDEEDRFVFVLPRKFRLAMPAAAKEKLKEFGRIEATKTQVKAALLNLANDGEDPLG